MSTVLWPNYLVDGTVVSTESDLYALYKHATKLDKLTRQLGLTRFLEFQDTTDAEYNVSNEELPQGMESTDELMAVRGTWIDAREALQVLEKLSAHIESEDIRFGLLSNAKEQVLAELSESIAFARKAADAGAKFNFAVVM